MNKNEDIKKQLEVKNKEIYIKKLNLDLDNNFEVLVLTIDNLLNRFSEEAVDKILEIEESFINKETIEKHLKEFINLYRNNLMNLFEKKKINLVNLITINDNVDSYIENINISSSNMKEAIRKFYLKNVDILESKLKILNENDFQEKRLNEFLNNIFFNNLNDKVNETIKSRDLILINTMRETYIKYLELNKNTVG